MGQVKKELESGTEKIQITFKIIKEMVVLESKLSVEGTTRDRSDNS